MMMRSIFGAAALAISVLATSTSAQEPRPVLNASSASLIVAACEAWAVERDMALVIAVFDQGGDLKAFLRMDEAPLASIAIAEWKGTSAAGIGYSSAQIGALAAGNPAIYHAPSLSTLRGGVPIRTTDNVLIGGVGVSGASGADDERCAIAGVEATGLVTGLPEAE
ncbi:MAG: heme-binding protein [Maricaulis sp.]|jgi:glc operon protein GlcG|nr:heme-binding protein [Maricaulis sp.]